MWNFVLLCSRHHSLVHALGFQLVLSPDRTLTVRTARDIPVPHHPDHPTSNADDLDPTSGRVSSDWANDRFDLSYVASMMLQHSS